MAKSTIKELEEENAGLRAENARLLTYWFMGYAEGQGSRLLNPSSIRTPHPMSQPSDETPSPLRHADTTGLNLPPRDAIAGPAPVRRVIRYTRSLCIVGSIVLLLLSMVLWHVGDRAERDVRAMRQEAQHYARAAAPTPADHPHASALASPVSSQNKTPDDPGCIFKYGDQLYTIGEDSMMEPYFPTKKVAPTEDAEPTMPAPVAPKPDQTNTSRFEDAIMRADHPESDRVISGTASTDPLVRTWRLRPARRAVHPSRWSR